LISNDERDDLLRDLASASNDIKKSAGGKSAEGVEKRYGIAYQQCVRAGIKPPLRKKYRKGA
jgi:hypothetical protein